MECLTSYLLITAPIMSVKARFVLQAASHVAFLPLDEDKPRSHVAVVWGLDEPYERGHIPMAHETLLPKQRLKGICTISTFKFKSPR